MIRPSASSSTTPSATHGKPSALRAFTLIEIMVTVVIIVILATIAIGIGSGVKANASNRATHATLKTLESLMKDYLAAGNPEPTPPASWPYSATDPVYAQTNIASYPSSDPINWVKALRAFPETAKKLSNLPTGNDGLSTPNVVILDAFGTPIRYVPYDTVTKKEGYFWSAGPSRTFYTGTAGQAADDLYSTDP